MRYTVWVIVLLAVTVGRAAEPGNPPVFETFPKIDLHAHYFEDVPGLADRLQAMHLTVVNICVRGNDPAILHEMEKIAENLHRKYPVFEFASTFDLTERYQPGWHKKVFDWLNRSYEAGAVMTKIWKEVGMEFKTPDGKWLMPDDPIFDPVYDFLAERGVPLIAHLAEPRAAWRPLDPDSPHYAYYSSHPEWHFYNKSGVPQWEDIIAARDRILEQHPDLTFIGAHLGSMAYDVNQIAVRLDKFNNFFVECAARTRDLMAQPAQKVRNFFIRYQDRIMYGTDIVRFTQRDGPLPANQREAWLQSIENRYRQDWQYYAGSGVMKAGNRQVECLALPVDVLRKFYSENAKRIVPALAH